MSCARPSVQYNFKLQQIHIMERKTFNSDFSIDHILNRAGDRFKKYKNHRQCESVTSSSSEDDESSDNNAESNKKCYENYFIDHQRLVEINNPPFHWLNYTRYNMPRIPSKLLTSLLVHSSGCLAFSVEWERC
jgi:hypothetical protein